MPRFKPKSRAEQVADYLRGHIVGGRWGDTLPEVHKLADEVAVNFKTVTAAIEILEAQGILHTKGTGRKRMITTDQVGHPTLRVGILPYELTDLDSKVDCEIFHLLQAAGHHFHPASKSLQDLGMNPARIAKFVQRQEVDVWIVSSGSREVLEWFATQQDKPVFAMYGRHTGLDMAGVAPRTIVAMEVAVARLVELGHRRIVMLCRDDRLVPEPGIFEMAFLETLQRHGIETSAYNLPQWGSSSEELLQCISSLFKITPPTALIAQETHLMVAASQRAARMGFFAPEKVSLICSDPNKFFSWCDPPMAHFKWDMNKVPQRVLDWVENIAHGREDKEQLRVYAEFVEAGTIGPAPR